MTIWLAALYSLCILGTGTIIFALGACFIMWAVESEHMVAFWLAALVESEHMVAFWLAALIACWIVLAMCTFTSKEALYDPHRHTKA